jgi:hypothetical protein
MGGAKGVSTLRGPNAVNFIYIYMPTEGSCKQATKQHCPTLSTGTAVFKGHIGDDGEDKSNQEPRFCGRRAKRRTLSRGSTPRGCRGMDKLQHS